MVSIDCWKVFLSLMVTQFGDLLKNINITVVMKTILDKKKMGQNKSLIFKDLKIKIFRNILHVRKIENVSS